MNIIIEFMLQRQKWDKTQINIWDQSLCDSYLIFLYTQKEYFALDKN